MRLTLTVYVSLAVGMSRFRCNAARVVLPALRGVVQRNTLLPDGCTSGANN